MKRVLPGRHDMPEMLGKSRRAINSHVMRAAEAAESAGWILECERRRNVSAALVGYFIHVGGVLCNG